MDIFKPQDIIFLVVIVGLFLKRNPNWFVVAGILAIIISIPLFQFWIFFTAQRLLIYAFFFILIGVLLNLPRIRDNSRDDNRN